MGTKVKLLNPLFGVTYVGKCVLSFYNNTAMPDVTYHMLKELLTRAAPLSTVPFSHVYYNWKQDELTRLKIWVQK